MSARRAAAPDPAAVRAHLAGLAVLAGVAVPRRRERFSVTLVGETDSGWLVEAESSEAAASIVHGTDPRAAECAHGELMVWTEGYYLGRYGTCFDAATVFRGWTVLEGGDTSWKRGLDR